MDGDPVNLFMQRSEVPPSMNSHPPAAGSATTALKTLQMARRSLSEPATTHPRQNTLWSRRRLLHLTLGSHTYTPPAVTFEGRVGPAGRDDFGRGGYTRRRVGRLGVCEVNNTLEFSVDA